MRINYVLRIESEYHIGSGLSRPGVVDETIIRRPDGQLLIPAEYFRGLIRDCCTQILYWTCMEKFCCEASLRKAPIEREGKGVPKTCGLNYRVNETPCVLCRIFGTTFTKKSYHFSDAEFERIEGKEKELVRISTHNRIDPSTGRVPIDLLFTFELGIPAIFKGHIERVGVLPEPNLLLEEVGLIIAGLRLVERVGKRSARGWGWAQVDEISLSLDDDLKAKLPSQVKEAPEDWRAWLNAFLSEGDRSGVDSFESKSENSRSDPTPF